MARDVRDLREASRSRVGERDQSVTIAAVPARVRRRLRRSYSRDLRMLAAAARKRATVPPFPCAQVESPKRGVRGRAPKSGEAVASAHRDAMDEGHGFATRGARKQGAPFGAGRSSERGSGPRTHTPRLRKWRASVRLETLARTHLEPRVSSAPCLPRSGALCAVVPSNAREE